MDGTILWAGKRLSGEEGVALRRVVAVFHRMGNVEDARYFERFLPENSGDWTPDELELGAHLGPWMSFGAGIRAADATDGDIDDFGDSDQEAV